MDTFLDEVARPTPTPGGGAVAAQVAALGAALVEMAVGLGHRRRPDARAEALLARVRDLRAELVRLREADAGAFAAVLAAMALPRDSDALRAQRRAALDRALVEAAQVPLDVVARTRELEAEVRAADPLALPSARSDLEVAAILLQAAARSAMVNVDVNLAAISDPELRRGVAQAAAAIGPIPRLGAGDRDGS